MNSQKAVDAPRNFSKVQSSHPHIQKKNNYSILHEDLGKNYVNVVKFIKFNGNQTSDFINFSVRMTSLFDVPLCEYLQLFNNNI